MKQKRLNRNSGFTLIELMIVVVILGVLAAMAIPRFLAVGTKSKQSEAKQILKQIYTSQRSYFMLTGEYWIPAGGTIARDGNNNAFATITVQVMTPARYSYTITGTPLTFTATATSGILDDDPTVDEWTIDQDGRLLVTAGKDDSEG